jgi:phospholipid transport system transporter-binding protein
VQLSPRLTLAEAGRTLASLQEAIARVPPGATFELDASALDDFDTSAIAVLLEGQRAARGRGVAFRLLAPPLKLARLAELYGVGELVGSQPAGTPDGGSP